MTTDQHITSSHLTPFIQPNSQLTRSFYSIHLIILKHSPQQQTVTPTSVALRQLIHTWYLHIEHHSSNQTARSLDNHSGSFHGTFWICCWRAEPLTWCQRPSSTAPPPPESPHGPWGCWPGCSWPGRTQGWVCRSTPQTITVTNTFLMRWITLW